jgi:hypothetical protein
VIALASLKQECETLMADLDKAPTFPMRAELHRTLAALKAAGKIDYDAIAKAGQKLAATMAKDDFLALDGRCAALADKLTAKCKELADSEDYAALEDVAGMLQRLRRAVPVTEQECEREEKRIAAAKGKECADALTFICLLLGGWYVCT